MGKEAYNKLFKYLADGGKPKTYKRNKKTMEEMRDIVQQELHPKKKKKGRKYNHYKYREICFRRYPKRICASCGEEGRVHVHHIDKNRRNNQIDNLIPLCIDCHREAHEGDPYLRLIGRGVTK